jgi:hypothetical protein
MVLTELMRCGVDRSGSSLVKLKNSMPFAIQSNHIVSRLPRTEIIEILGMASMFARFGPMISCVSGCANMDVMNALAGEATKLCGASISCAAMYSFAITMKSMPNGWMRMEWR